MIHKLTKDISMLRRKKTKSEADKSKNERKVARFVQEVQVMTNTGTGSIKVSIMIAGQSRRQKCV